MAGETLDRPLRPSGRPRRQAARGLDRGGRRRGPRGDAPALFVGHGLGAAAIADAAAALEGADVRGAFLVAPPDKRGLERLAGPDWTPPRAPLPWPSVVVASRNDPLGAYDAVAALASDWGADLVDAGEAGGLDAASGHGPWPEGLLRLAAFIKGIEKKPGA